MSEHEIRELLRDVRAGHLSRRDFVETMAGLSLAAPLAREMLVAAGLAEAQTRTTAAPAKRGGGGALKALWWDAPNILNPVLAVGLKDWNAGSLFYEPLVYFDPQANLVPVLAREVPSVKNGGVAKDGTSVTWHLKHDVQWHDSKPIGTGPYRFVDFKPGDLLKAEISPSYHVPNRPFFDTVEIKGGGDAASAARAVLQTGEYDYAAEVGGVEDDVLKRLEQGGK